MHKKPADFAGRLRDLMHRDKLTVEQLASKIAVSKDAVVKWRGGQVPTATHLNSMVAVFHCTADYLLGNIDVSANRLTEWGRVPLHLVPADVLKSSPHWKHIQALLEIADNPEAVAALQNVVRNASRSGLQKNYQKGIDKVTLKDNSKGVEVELKDLIEAVRVKASEPGRKAELARLLGVTPQQISAWLSGTKEPGGKYTVKLANWVGWLGPK